MYRDELLEYLKGRISEHDFVALIVWTKNRERFLFWKTKFDVDLPTYCHGYWVRTAVDSILVS